jgi:hypothetical protein
VSHADKTGIGWIGDERVWSMFPGSLVWTPRPGQLLNGTRVVHPVVRYPGVVTGYGSQGSVHVHVMGNQTTGHWRHDSHVSLRNVSPQAAYFEHADHRQVAVNWGGLCRLFGVKRAMRLWEEMRGKPPSVTLPDEEFWRAIPDHIYVHASRVMDEVRAGLALRRRESLAMMVSSLDPGDSLPSPETSDPA